jgi:general stress protein CsbA
LFILITFLSFITDIVTVLLFLLSFQILYFSLWWITLDCVLEMCSQKWYSDTLFYWL